MVDESAETKQQQAEIDEAPEEAVSEQASEPAQSEQSDAEQNVPSRHRKADLIARIFSIIALITALAVLGGGVMLWRQLENYDQDKEIAGLQSEFNALSQQLQRLNTTQSQRQAKMAQESRTMQASIQRLSELVSRNQNDWSLAEIEYLLSMANQRIQLHADHLTAIEALALADGLIEKLADPAWFPVREKIATELAALRSVPNIDYAGISAQLTGLSAQVPALPVVKLDRNEVVSQAAEEIATPNVDGWQAKVTQMLRDIWAELKGLVKIRQTDEEVKPLLSPVSQQFLIQNVQLQFQSARVAMLQRDSNTYSSALQTASSWVTTHFQSNAEAVIAIQKDIESLLARDVAASIPDISGSLSTMRQIQKTRRQSSGTQQ